MTKIQLPVSFFENDKLKAIRSQKDGDSVILLFIMLITVAVKSDCEGQLMLCEGVPYDEKILSGILNMPLPIVKSGMELLIKFGLLSIEKDIISLANYSEFTETSGRKKRRDPAG